MRETHEVKLLKLQYELNNQNQSIHQGQDIAVNPTVKP